MQDLLAHLAAALSVDFHSQAIQAAAADVTRKQHGITDQLPA